MIRVQHDKYNQVLLTVPVQNEVNAVPQALALKVESMVKCFCGKYCARSSCAVAISR